MTARERSRRRAFNGADLGDSSNQPSKQTAIRLTAVVEKVCLSTVIAQA